MRLLFAAVISLFSMSALAQNNCQKYAGNERYTKAIHSVAKYAMYDFEQLCNLPTVLDIEAQPDRVITREGDVIPHVRIQLHREYDSCLYMVRDADQEITSARCYNGW